MEVKIVAIEVLFTYDYGKARMDLVKALGYNVTLLDERTITNSENIKNTEVLVCYNPFNTLSISLMKSLKLIQLSSVGIDQLPFEDVKQAGIIITNNKGGYSIPMGEWIVMNVLQLFKNSNSLYKHQLNKKWKMDTSLLELYGKTVGFIGTGTIAIEAAKRLQGFGVKILGLNTTGSHVQGFERCFKMDELDFLLLQCDVVVITIPSTKETYHLMDENRFNNFKAGAILINVARGNILDEKALIKALTSKKLRGAALDVFEEEPLNKDNELWKLDNVIITPHNCWVSEMRNERRWNVIYENLKRYANGEQLINLVNLDKGY